MTSEQCKHEWVVVYCSYPKPTIMVICQLCGAKGGVQTFTDEEWALAYYAPSMPFRWADSSRVTLLEDLPVPTAEEKQAFNDFLAGGNVSGLKLTQKEVKIAGLKLTDNKTGRVIEEHSDQDEAF